MRTLLGASEVSHLHAFQVNTQILEDCLATGQDRDVTEDRLATIAVTGCLDGTSRKDATHLVNDQGREVLRLRRLRR